MSQPWFDDELRQQIATLGPYRGRGEDPLITVARNRWYQEVFSRAHPRLYCPSCKKRCSSRYDQVWPVDPGSVSVECVCHHCEYRWWLPYGTAVGLAPRPKEPSE